MVKGHSWEITEEIIEVDMDILSDFEDVATDKKPPDTTTPEPQKIAVDKKLLPQLPKNVTIKEKVEAEVAKKEVDKKVDKDSGEAPKKEEETVLAKKDDDSNKIDQKDLKKRAAIERLRKLKIPDSENKDLDKIKRMAELNEKMASAIDAAAKLGDVSSRKKCQALIYRSVRQHYVLPETYGFSESELKVSIRVVINNEGEMVNNEIKKSSGDIVFDDVTSQAVLSASPFPIACRKFAGQDMILNFNSSQI